MSKLKFFAAFLVLNTVFILSCSNVDDLDLPKPGTAASDHGSSAGSSSSVLSSSSKFSSSSSFNPNPNIQRDWDFERNIFIDQRDDKEYGFAISGSQVWMTENLNYSGSNTLGWCYGVDIDSPASHRDSTTCDNGYGRTYDYPAVQTGGFPRGICPQGWHVPTNTELGTASALTRIYAGNYNLNETYPPLGWKERGESGFYWTSSGNEYFAFTNNVGISQAQSTASAQDKFSVRCLADATQSCGGTPYEIGNQFCCGGTSIYDPSTHSCQGGSLVEKTYVLFEDFEGTSSNWSILSGSGTNHWMIGTSTYNGGSRSAYITSNGSSYGYSESSTSTSNLYTTVSFPSQTANFTISFNWKGMGENSYDNMTVYLVPSDVSVTNAAPTSGRIGETYYAGKSNWTLENITLSALTYGGKTYKLVFHWKNDYTMSDGLPAAIDNVRITN